MTRLNRSATALCTSLLLLAQGAIADGNDRYLGIGEPATVDELPPGKLRQELEALSPDAREQALEWLQGISFPAEDIHSLRVSAEGAVLYVDAFGHPDPDSHEGLRTGDEAAMEEAQVFNLHSRPGSGNVVFLDFDGHTISGTAWSSDTLIARPFDPSGNDPLPTEADFTADELNAIAEIWHRISEDFAAFDIDVTTEEPATFTPTTGRILFTHHIDALGQPMPYPTSGGVAYVDVFGRSDYAYYSPALVYYTNLALRSQGLLVYNAGVGSHEFGHNLGLSHDGKLFAEEYYPGHGEGLVSWAPVMGNMLDKNVTQWSKGEYPGANNLQDDLFIIAGDLGHVADDHSDSAAGATAIWVEANGDVLVSSPELDPDNLLPHNKGVIDDRDDVDWFYFDVDGPSTVELTATPAWHSFYRDDARGANLDIELTLMDSGLNTLAYDEPGDDTNASVFASVPAGRYFLQVDGVGNDNNSDYSDYASTGMYFIEGYITDGPADVSPPAPATMSWETPPHATGESSISMTAVEATDESGGVQYYFRCVAGGVGCTDSGWRSDRTYEANGLSPDTYYAFAVKARDAAGNENGESASAGDTTDAPAPTNEPPAAIASYSPEPAVITKGKTVNVTLDGSASSDPEGSIAAWSWKDADGNVIGTNMTMTLKLKQGNHEFTLTVTDDEGASDNAVLEVPVTGGGGKGKPPK